MCGRTTLVVTAEDLEATFGYEVPAGYRPTYNRAPGQDHLCLVGGSESGFQMIEWGLAASPGGEARRIINARGETVASNRLFRDAFEHRRCGVVVDGFYEWKADPHGSRPHRIHRRDDAPFLLAGIWETGSDERPTCAIITTEASRLISPIHDRMPVILPAGSWERWLGADVAPGQLEELLVPYTGAEIEAYEVSTHVNSTTNDDERCIRPVAGPEQLVLGSF